MAGPVAIELAVGVQMIRKKGKLPGTTLSHAYDLEYGHDTLNSKSSALSGKRVAIVDDIFATGGTLSAATSLIRKQGSIVVCSACILELAFLNGKTNLTRLSFHWFKLLNKVIFFCKSFKLTNCLKMETLATTTPPILKIPPRLAFLTCHLATHLHSGKNVHGNTCSTNRMSFSFKSTRRINWQPSILMHPSDTTRTFWLSEPIASYSSSAVVKQSWVQQTISH